MLLKITTTLAGNETSAAETHEASISVPTPSGENEVFKNNNAILHAVSGQINQHSGRPIVAITVEVVR